MSKDLMPKKRTNVYVIGNKLGIGTRRFFLSFAPHNRGRASRGKLLPAVATLAVALAVSSAQAQSGEITTICTNPVSGTSWQIRIDYDKSTVDSNPARISAARIWWHDAKDGGNYTLDRKSGDLTVIVASSTGGAFFYHRCKLLS